MSFLKRAILTSTMLLVVLSIVSISFFDRDIGVFLSRFNAVVFESYLRVLALIGIIMVCVLWIILYYIMYKHYQWQLKERLLKEEQQIHRYLMDLNAALNNLGAFADETTGLMAVKTVEDALMIHFSKSELNMPLRNELPRIETLVQALFDHLKLCLSERESAARKDAGYALRLLYGETKIAMALSERNLYPTVIKKLYFDASMIRGYLSMRDLTLEACTFVGDWSFAHLGLQGKLVFRDCLFEGSLETHHDANLNLGFKDCTFNDPFIASSKGESDLVIRDCLFIDQASLTNLHAKNVTVSGCSFNRDLVIRDVQVEVLMLKALESLGGIVFTGAKVKHLLSLDSVRCMTDILFQERAFEANCEICIKNTRVKDESFVWLAHEHTSMGVEAKRS